jgi:hypothetical protein
VAHRLDSLWVRDAKNQPKHAGPILEAFKRADIVLTPQEGKEAVHDKETVVIAVGSHP